MIIFFRGPIGSGKTSLSKILKKELNKKNLKYFHLDGDEFRNVLGNILSYDSKGRSDSALSMTRLITLLNDQRMNLVVSSLFVETKQLKLLLKKVKFLSFFIDVDIEKLKIKNKKNLYKSCKNLPVLHYKYGPLSKKCKIIKNDMVMSKHSIVRKILNDHLFYIIDNSY